MNATVDGADSTNILVECPRLYNHQLWCYGPCLIYAPGVIFLCTNAMSKVGAKSENNGFKAVTTHPMGLLQCAKSWEVQDSELHIVLIFLKYCH